MSQSYLEKRVKAALAEAKGSKMGARKLLLSWVISDQQLLLGMVRRHLPALAMQAVEFVLARAAAQAAGLPKPAKPGDNIGKDLIAALGGKNAAKFGQEDAAPPLSKRAASQQHIDAIHKLAQKPSRKV